MTAQKITRVITRDLAEEWAIIDGGVTELHSERLEERRWYSIEELVFTAPDDGLPWCVTYKQGLTEMQEQDPFDDADQVTLTRMEPYEKTVTAWRPVKAGL